ncbi:TIGR02391 family protein [Hyphomonas johnsonii]|uniref:Conserved hypothetical protein CHP02391 domain-containing protein n=1 Tax=Hyphomonas johnsonii MHS-2 TaxID=1280950 RepID=A0A059FQQ1_9PROT|nr:TIGR02391 family protein [Hyphomonas johnsonii]KCZ92974.1 hypothetical protein HJO_08462 [Hyphomonas johnsonii MHS-2]
MIFGIKELQKSIDQIGLGAKTISIPASSFQDVEVEDRNGVSIFDEYVAVIDDDDIISVTRDLFASGFHSEAVEAAFKLLDDQVRSASGIPKSGAGLMEKVFSPSNPVIALNAGLTQSELDEQAGYHRIFSGSMLGIRNPCAHELTWISDAKAALEALILCQHLTKKLKRAMAAKLP